jgi:hypothetical protein
MRRYVRMGGGYPRLKNSSLVGIRWREQQEAARLDAAIKANLRELGYGG